MIEFLFTLTLMQNIREWGRLKMVSVYWNKGKIYDSVSVS